MKLIFKWIVLVAFFSFFLCCKGNTKSTSLAPPSILDTITKKELKEVYSGILKSANIPQSLIDAELEKIKYDVVITKLEYKAKDPFGEEKTVSGLVSYPLLSKEESFKSLSVVSIQHGTLFYSNQAPTKIAKKNWREGDFLSLIAASNEKGYISLQPDYFGYGTDANNPHYYEVAASLAETTRKLIENVPAFADNQGIKINFDRLYLLGYSEGGSATMATLQSFSGKESDFKDFITIARAGAYDKPATSTYIMQQTKGDSPSFTASYAWVLLTYNLVYNINKKISYLFTPKVVPEINKYVGNNLIMQTRTLPSSPKNVFNKDFLKGMLNGEEPEMQNAFVYNDVSNFNAKGKVILVHGDKDTWVPTFNTINTTKKLKDRGVNVISIIVPGGTHSSTYPAFFYEVVKALN